jgi:hypothetical protein
MKTEGKSDDSSNDAGIPAYFELLYAEDKFLIKETIEKW